MSTKKRAAATKAASAAPPCDRGPDTKPRPLRLKVEAGKPVSFDFFYCFTPGHLIVKLDEVVLLDRVVPPPETVHLDVAPLPSGHHALSWLFRPINVTWKAVSEVSIAGVMKRRKSDDNNSPLSVVLDVVFLEVS